VNASFFAELFSNAWNVALVFVFLGISIFVHELGHFLVARKRGMKVDRFSIGFGPKVFGWRGKDGVEYRVSLLPLGGYVSLPQMADMEAIEGEASTPREQLPAPSFTDKACVLVAGAGFNFLFALFIACVLWAVGLPVAPETETTTIGYVVKEVSPKGDAKLVTSPAYAAGLKAGDQIVAVDGFNVSRFAEVTNFVMTGTGRAADGRPRAVLSIERDGKVADVEIFPVLVEINAVSGDAVRRMGVMPAQALEVGRVAEGSPAAAAGLQVGDKLLKLDGEPLYHAMPLLEKTGKGEAVRLTIARGDTPREITLQPAQVAVTQPMAQVYLPGQTHSALSLFDAGKGAGLALFSLDDEGLLPQVDLEQAVVLKSVNGAAIADTAALLQAVQAAHDRPITLEFSVNGAPQQAVLPAGTRADVAPHRVWAVGVEFSRAPQIVHRNPLAQIGDVFTITWRTLTSLLSPSSDVGVSMLSGPVGILRVYHQLLSADFRLVLWFTVLLNVNLGILNLLPLPVLDGGHVLFAFVEKLRGKPLPLKVLTSVNGAFMLLLLGMIVYVTFFDSRRWQGENRAENLAAERARCYVNPVFPPHER